MRLLASEMAPGDQLGVLTTQGQINFRPSSDLSRVRRAVDTSSAEADDRERRGSPVPHQTRARRARIDAGAHRRHADHHRGLLGRPDAAGAEDHRHDPARAPTAAQVADASNDICPVGPEDFENIGMLAAARQGRSLSLSRDRGQAVQSSSQDAGFESLAGVTGAEFIRVTASPQAGVSRLLRETASYYTASFEPELGKERRQRSASSCKRRATRSAARAAVGRHPEGRVARAAASPKDMLRTPAAYPRPAAARRRPHLADAGQRRGARWSRCSKRSIPRPRSSAASVGLFDEKNTLKKQWTAQPDGPRQAAGDGRLQAPPGTYRVRVAAVDAAGRAGTTDYELKVEVPRADPLKLSALVSARSSRAAGSRRASSSAASRWRSGCSRSTACRRAAP